MLLLHYIMWYCLVFTGILFLVSGIDDVIFDIIYWLRRGIKKIRYYGKKPLQYDDLLLVPEKNIALIVACWQEAGVIQEMVRHNLQGIDYHHFHIFIGVYPNDPETLEAARASAAKNSRVHCAVNIKNGPTNKADNLNSIYRCIQAYEVETGVVFDIIVMHDPEDVIHPMSFKMYNYFIPKKPMIQVPVFPIPTENYNFVNWTYSDEFAEIHTKDLIAREMMGGFVPSAGVGTAFDRQEIIKMGQANGGNPFHQETFTEDYSTALSLQLCEEAEPQGRAAIFLVQTVERVQMKPAWHGLGAMQPRKIKEFIATRALFPFVYAAAVRQRSRWTLGIVLQNWKHVGWPGNWMTKFMLFHDRKAVFTHFTGGFAYFVFIYWLSVYIYALYHPYSITLEYFFQKNPWVYALMYACLFLMLNRMLQRMIATSRIYGIIPGVLAIPRIFLSNLINMHAYIRALQQFLSALSTPKKARWVKTNNQFPLKEKLAPFQRRLGDILLTQNRITANHLVHALKQQKLTGKKLGVILMDEQQITENDLLLALAAEYNMEARRIRQEDIMPPEALPALSTEQYHWLVEHAYRPLALKSGNILVLGITNPQEDLEHSNMVMQKTEPYTVEFVMVQWSAPLRREDKKKPA